MYLADWELGSIESICVTVLAGFCVDYIVHSAHSFNECDDTSRVARVEYAVGHMGISVLGGRLTSLGASAPLFFGTLQFFSSFGAFFFGTIIVDAANRRFPDFFDLSLNFFFVPLLATLGPGGSTGDFYRWMVPKRGEDGFSDGAAGDVNDVVVNLMDGKSPDDA
jgi:hypothetical protein